MDVCCMRTGKMGNGKEKPSSRIPCDGGKNRKDRLYSRTSHCAVSNMDSMTGSNKVKKEDVKMKTNTRIAQHNGKTARSSRINRGCQGGDRTKTEEIA